VRDLAGEGARPRDAGPIAQVELPGGVPVWAATRHAEARKLLTDSRLVKDISTWGAWQRGEIPRTWSMIGLADSGPSMLTFDGSEHRRLRNKPAVTQNELYELPVHLGSLGSWASWPCPLLSQLRGTRAVLGGRGATRAVTAPVRTAPR